MVRAKKNLGQHFLVNKQISKKIVESLYLADNNYIIEVGPGTGALTEHLIKLTNISIYLVDIDLESIQYLKGKFNNISHNILHQDFLSLKIKDLFNNNNIIIIGNFPYNISSQIVFKILENRHTIGQVVGTFQYEVATRIAAKPNSKAYGILSVLTQLYYNTTLLFSINKEEFYPEPKVKSAVIRLERRCELMIDDEDEQLFKKIVKAAFAHRRKTLKNNLKQFDLTKLENREILSLRAENLSVADYISLTHQLK